MHDVTLATALQVVAAFGVGLDWLLQVAFHVRVIQLLLQSSTVRGQLFEKLLVVLAPGLVTDVKLRIVNFFRLLIVRMSSD